MRRARKSKTGLSIRNFNVSNELLAVLLVVAIGLSVINLYAPLDVSGFATSEENATAAVEILAVTAINWTENSIDWGAGAVATGMQNATLNSSGALGNVTEGNWSNNNGSLFLENIGGDDVTLTLQADQGADALIGGTSPTFMWQAADSESTSCIEINWSDFTEVSNSTADLFCNPLNSSDSQDMVTLDFYIRIPSDATQTGARTAVITAIGTSV